MTTTNNKTKTSKDVIKPLSWLIEAVFRAFVGYWLLAHSHNYIIVAVAIYALLTAGLIVAVHFVNAHKA